MASKVKEVQKAPYVRPEAIKSGPASADYFQAIAADAQKTIPTTV